MPAGLIRTQSNILVDGLKPGALITPQGLVIASAFGTPVVGVPSPTWPNEPVGFSTWFDVSWDVTNPDPTRWEWLFGEGSNGTIISDAGDPVSPPNVLKILYPNNFTGGGQAPIKAVWNDSSPLLHLPKEIFLGFTFKVSNPWQSHDSGVNKVFFLNTATAGGSTVDWFPVIMFGDGANGTAPFHWRIALFETNVSEPRQWAVQNLNPNLQVTLGVWHKIEVYSKYSSSTTSGDGTLKVWMDGIPVMDYSDINHPNTGWGQVELTPVWGGNSAINKSETDFFLIGHTRVSVHA